jgi:vacuolar-type H+-ATPase subunit I/STV1
LDKSSKENLKNDIEIQLDDFFGESDAPSPGQTPSASMEKLKSVVLSIDWEITDACLDDLDAEIDIMLPQYQHDRLIHALLRMLKALGHYIRSLKAQAHPDAIKRVMSSFNSLEELICDEQLTKEAKKQILAKEIAAFKDLKQQVERKRGGAAARSVANQGNGHFVDHLKFEQAMSDVEKRLNEQVKLLKSQLENVQKEIDTLRKG